MNHGKLCPLGQYWTRVGLFVSKMMRHNLKYASTLLFCVTHISETVSFTTENSEFSSTKVPSESCLWVCNIEIGSCSIEFLQYSKLQSYFFTYTVEYKLLFNVELLRLVPLSLEENVENFDLLGEMTRMTTIFYFYPSKHSPSLG